MDDNPADRASGTAPFFRSSYWLLGLGFALLVGYFVAARMTANFVDPSTHYMSVYSSQPLGAIERFFDRDYSKYRLLGLLWKLTLLLPATLCLTLYLARRLSPERVERFLAWLEALSPRRVLIGVTAALLVALLFVSQAILQGQPVYDDERAYEFQARVLKTGHFAADEPPGKGCFKNYWIVIADGKWFGKYSFGHSFLLALGSVAGSPYLVPILMASLIPLLVYLLGREQYGRRAALLAAALFAVSPAFLFTSATLMNHATSLFFLCLFVLFFQASAPGRSWLYPFLAGASLGCVLNIRPQDSIGYGAAFALLGLAQLVRAPSRRPLFLRQLVMLGGFALLLGFFLFYNKSLTGQYLKTPFAYYRTTAKTVEQDLFDQAIEKAEGPRKPVEKKSLAERVRARFRLYGKWTYYLLARALRMNLWLFGWPCSLLFIMLCFARGGIEKPDLAFLTVLAFHSLFFTRFGGAGGVMELGARAFFPLLPFLMLLTAREMLRLHAWLRRVLAGSQFQGAALVPAFVILSSLLAFATFYAEKTMHFIILTDRVAQPYRAVEQAGIHNAIVQIESQPRSGWVFGYRIANPDLSDDVIYTRAVDPRDLLELANHMPERSLFTLRSDADKGRIVIEPLERATLEALARAAPE